jgi:hypothetical protein
MHGDRKWVTTFRKTFSSWRAQAWLIRCDDDDAMGEMVVFADIGGVDREYCIF